MTNLLTGTESNCGVEMMMLVAGCDQFCTDRIRASPPHLKNKYFQWRKDFIAAAHHLLVD